MHSVPYLELRLTFFFVYNTYQDKISITPKTMSIKDSSKPDLNIINNIPNTITAIPVIKGQEGISFSGFIFNKIPFNF
jgi:hypothetical protein